jgi:hypothetical protein
MVENVAFNTTQPIAAYTAQLAQRARERDVGTQPREEPTSSNETRSGDRVSLSQAAQQLSRSDETASTTRQTEQIANPQAVERKPLERAEEARASAATVAQALNAYSREASQVF